MLAVLIAAGVQGTSLAQGSTPDIPWLRIVLALGFCLTVAASSIWLLRARHGMSMLPERFKRWTGAINIEDPLGVDRLRLLQRLPISPGSQLVLVRLGTRTYLLHLTASNVTEIDRFTDSQGAGV
ncbi:flagellar biosynthetic protein FliO [Altererythrobacter sp. Z27]|uniref:flagellar biosynthetic protein FliO n=1 Tax=Altererythrobacter sp. Z27 TaxID=3461147 RepID=UPI004044C77E